MSDELPPLPSDIRDLISADRHGDTLEDERRRRIARNVGAAVLAGGAVGVAMSATTKGGLVGAISAFFSRKGAIAVTAFALGGATGAGGLAVASKMAQADKPALVCPSVAVESPKPAPVIPVAPTTPASAAPSPSASASASAAPSTVVPAPSVSATSEFAAEKEQIETARSALLHGNPQNALTACGEHEKRFPKGKLVEEREYIAIASLIRLGHDAEARTRFDSFKKRFPQSFYAASLEKELGKP
jgi:hypothetical protein